MVTPPSAAAFVAAHKPQVREDISWGSLRLHVASYLTARLPPLELITSARAVLLRAHQVMVVQDPENVHILPGGRREPGESLERALRRELLEETGWAIGDPHLLGVKRFRYCDAKPADFAYPDHLYPEFFQAVHVARAESFHPEARELDGYEMAADYQPIADAAQLPLPPNERLFLRTALSWHERSWASRPHT
jgi:8-oxo-dGTP pyrophosphatase MutT (NUDIX family)